MNFHSKEELHNIHLCTPYISPKFHNYLMFRVGYIALRAAVGRNRANYIMYNASSTSLTIRIRSAIRSVA